MNIAIACGGTGGHVFPGLATARELLSRGHEVTLWLTGRDTEQAARQTWDGPVIEVAARGLPAGFSGQALQRAAQLGQAIWRCRARMRQTRPAVLLAMGSYASVGPCGAARLLGIPIVLHEANVIPGRAVRLFARRAAAVAVGFEETRYHLPRARLHVVGMPLRDELTAATRAQPPRPPAAPFRFLVMGGSMGARRLNEVVTTALARVSAADLPFAVTHLTGRDDESTVRAAYAAANIPADVIAFTNYMAPLYHAADFAICRAGASTCAELAYFGLPALLVPYPHAAMDHQTANARAVEKRGAADVVAEADLTPAWLEAYLQQALRKPARRARLREAALKTGTRNGAADLAALVEQCARP